jgi:CRISPR-associated protein Csh1
MGFVQAIADIGGLDRQAGLESYLKYPLEKGGKVIRVYLDVEDLNADCLKINGIKKIDMSDQITGPDMKMKYLYRDKVGANVNWGFTPLHKLGKPRANREANAKEWVGNSGEWTMDNKCHLNKIKNRVLLDYEREGIFHEGSTDVIMKQLEEHMNVVLDAFTSNESHVVLFGAVNKYGEFVYPGQIPAFVSYFNKKLKQSLHGKRQQDERYCSLCGKLSSDTTTLSSVFKFATMDKVNFLPGLESKRQDMMFAVCQSCFEKISAGRERVERTLTSTGVIPGLRLWVIPEGVGPNSSMSVKECVFRLEQLWDSNKMLESIGEKAEEKLFRQMAREGNDLVFHFLFWEKNKAMELVHLMVEDVPPERLAFLSRQWEKATKAILGDVEKAANLDWAIKSLYATLYRFAGKSESDKIVFRDLALKILGKMLRGERLPIATFKQAIVKRSARLVYETDNWDDVKRSLLYAQIWVEYMNHINRG